MTSFSVCGLPEQAPHTKVILNQAIHEIRQSHAIALLPMIDSVRSRVDGVEEDSVSVSPWRIPHSERPRMTLGSPVPGRRKCLEIPA